MARRFIDISATLEAGIASDPPVMLPSIEYFSHAATTEQITAFFPGLTSDDLPGGEGWAVETMTLSTHNGTHMDAPYHHHSTMDGGKPALKIDEVPLEWCMNPGVKLDFRNLGDGHVVNAKEVEAELSRIGHDLKPLDIVVVNTSAGAAYGDADYIHRGCGMGREATLYLLERGVRLTGTDAWSWDAPFLTTARRWSETKDPSIIWEGHRASMDIGYSHIEKLANLESVPPTGFTICAFPMKIKAASAGFTRAVAIIEE